MYDAQVILSNLKELHIFDLEAKDIEIKTNKKNISRLAQELMTTRTQVQNLLLSFDEQRVKNEEKTALLFSEIENFKIVSSPNSNPKPIQSIDTEIVCSSKLKTGNNSYGSLMFKQFLEAKNYVETKLNGSYSKIPTDIVVNYSVVHHVVIPTYACYRMGFEFRMSSQLFVCIAKSRFL
jgi:hypothetical protein